MNDTKEKSPPKQEEMKNSFATFLWNPWRKEFCGRTASSWGKIFVFYVIFYICLAAFWSIMLLIFRTTIDDKHPKWKLDESRIGSNPGLGYRPRPPRERLESTLIRFRRNNEKSYKHWVEDLTQFVHGQNASDSGGASLAIDCEKNQISSDDQFCAFNVRDIGSPCSPANSFGYRDGKPCVLIKLNRIFDWKPQTYDPQDYNNPALPQELRDVMKMAYDKNKSNRYIYITCQGQNPIDKENIGQIQFFPEPGIRDYYFPFRNQDNYKSPFVFVQFTNPSHGLVINVECKAWAKNIKHNLLEREGSVHFELSIE
ncbi:sodium/potassium-transporting ATPase subunit beta [Tetranychus urticae]|uniref:Sodium/potassium-transporting ATPase subunit beta n=1 Tax=Tetranychus urticae TaxID=32264 RepID=T1L398_TETUR|nr:sodium/potassium-transporting ATPase subunit beta [Tetranychus urticae]